MNSKGAIITMVLVFGGIFLLIFGSLLGFILLEHRNSLNSVAESEALRIAESGISYAQWRLLHGSNYEFSIIRDYEVEGEVIGHYHLEIIPPTDCFPSAVIRSTGWRSDFPTVRKTIKVYHGKLPWSRYSFLTDSDVWFGSGETVNGLVHSNGGIRMDGAQNCLFSSAKEVYTCEPRHGCSPSQERPGIWGEGQGKEAGLWRFLDSEMVSEIDFTAILENFDDLKNKSQPNYYFSDSGARGYWVEFLGQEFKVYRVLDLSQEVWGWNMEDWVKESNTINSYQEIGTYSLPSSCQPIFIEDNVWVSGTVQGRVTLIAARLPYVPGNGAKMIIKDNVGYQGDDSALGLIAQKDILIPLFTNSALEIKAALLAKEGSVMRYFYPSWDEFPYNSYSLQGSIQIYGSIISKKGWTFSWVDDGQNVVSGYINTNINSDSNLIYQPPPYFMDTAGKNIIINWEEEEL